LESLHDDVVARLAPQRGERWLDVATGTGGVAIRAARARAEVTALDITPALLDQARAAAVAVGVDVELVEGDAQALPFGNADFAVVSSCFGVIFAPDRVAAARELARVCRPGGRLGLTAWRPDQGFHTLAERFLDERPASDAAAWGEDGALEELLGDAFELEIEERTLLHEAVSLEAHYEWVITAVPPMAAFISKLDPSRHEEFREYFRETHARFVQPDGRLVEERRYLLALGARR
jgi:ubiquinone/menaquinone biosynthesis C-methylase UbiE